MKKNVGKIVIGNESATDIKQNEESSTANTSKCDVAVFVSVREVCVRGCWGQENQGRGGVGTHWWTSTALLFILFRYDADSCQFGIHWLDNGLNIFARRLRRSDLSPHKLQGLSEERSCIFKVWPRRGKNTSMHNFPLFPYSYLDSTLAAVDLWASTASEWLSSDTADWMKPSPSVNTATELDFLLTPRT